MFLYTFSCGKSERDEEHLDYNIEKKMVVITYIINTLGFNLKDLKIVLSREIYYENFKKLISKNSDFNKNYNNIRLLFEKDKHELKDNLTGSPAVKLLNGFLEEFGLSIITKRTTKKINDKLTTIYMYTCVVNGIFKPFL